MHKFILALLLTVVASAIITLPRVSLANTNDRFAERFERFHERIDDAQARMNLKMDSAQTRMNTRINEAKERICTRLGEYSSIGTCDSSYPPKPTLEFTASPLSITEGATTTLSWKSENATHCEASEGWSGEKKPSGNLTLSPSTTRTYKLSCTGANGSVARAVTVTVSPAPEAPALSFTGDPLSISIGSSTTLSWTSEHTTLCIASGGWSGEKDTNGSAVVSPTSTTLYTLSCGGGNATTTKTVTINVTDTPVVIATVSITANPLLLSENGSTTLSWESERATYCEASGGWSGEKPLSGSTEVFIGTSTMFFLTCTNDTQSASSSVMVTVASSTPLPTIILDATPQSIIEGSSSMLSWNATNANTCLKSDGWIGTASTSGEESVTPTTTTTYTLTCEYDSGTSSTSVTVTVHKESSVNHLLLSEVLYDLANDNSQGSESGGKNEWVELYNPTESPVDLNGWTIGNSTSTGERIASSSVLIEPHGYAIITNATSTAEFWNFGSTTVMYVGESINGGFANSGDYIGLFDQNGEIVDAMSYGSNTDAFNPSVQTVSSGHSLSRLPVSVDTDGASDWSENTTPNPGS